MKDDENLARFDADKTSRKDAFGRTMFAASIARHLGEVSRESGFVLGIEGEWGSGKTFLLDLIRSELGKQSSKPIVVDLNPWLISGTESVICSFLAQLASAIGADRGTQAKEGVEVGRKLLGYMSAFLRVSQPASLLVDQSGFLAGLIGVAGSTVDTTKASSEEIGKLLGTADLKAQRAQVVSELTKLPCPIVVIVDDLDRLPANEIRVMFQAIKAVADFPGIIYLLAYDPVVVDEALDKESAHRARYREKIIQVAYPIPHLHPWDRAQFVRERLDEVIRGCIGDLPEFVAKPAYEKAVAIGARLCIHPRDVLRLCNRLRISLITLQANINTADLIVVEALAYRFPELAKAIRDFPSDFSMVRHSLDIMDEEEAFQEGFLRAVEREENLQPTWERHLPKDVGDKVLASKACEFLFGKNSDQDSKDLRTKNRHIREPHLLAMYCALAQAEGIPSPTSIEELFRDPAKLRATIEEDDFEAWMSWVEKFPPRAALPDPEGTLEVLIEAAWKYHVRGQGDWQPISSLGKIWSELVAVIPDSEVVGKLFQQLIATASLSMSCVPVVLAARQHGLLSSREQDIQPEDQRFIKDGAVVKEAIAAWRSKVSDEVGNDNLAKEPQLQHILYRWRQLPGSSSKEAWRLVDRICSSQEGLDLFLQPYRNKDSDYPAHIGDFVPLIWNIDELIQRISKFSMGDRYQQLIEGLRSEEVIRRHSELKKVEDVVNGSSTP